MGEVNLALCICTYKREQYIKNNLALIDKYVIKNNDCSATNHVRVYIADNGKTLDAKLLSNDKVKIFPNMNGGGSAGFSRAILEAIKDRKKYNITHCVLMDDDVVLNYSTIERTYVFIRLLKDKYKTAIIGGAMINLDRPYIQHAAGEHFNNKWGIVSPKCELNLASTVDVIKNTKEDKIHYCGWWYCAIDISLLDNNLPMPFFFQYDDSEFGLRTSAKKIVVPGICLWHEAFCKKISVSKEYYWKRNCFIMQSLHDKNFSKKGLKKFVLSTIIRNLFVYDYDRANMVLLAVNDYLKGADWLKTTNPEELNKNVSCAFAKMTPIELLDVNFSYSNYVENIYRHDSKIKHYIRLLLLNGMYLKAHEELFDNDMPAVRADYPDIATCFRRKRVLKYDVYSDTGLIAEKNYKEFWRVFRKYLLTGLNINFKFNKAKESYKDSQKLMTSNEFWKHYLHIS